MLILVYYLIGWFCQCNYCKELEGENKKLNETKLKLHGQGATLKETIVKLEANEANLRTEIDARGSENSSLNKVTIYQRENIAKS